MRGAFSKLGVEILGISVDSVESHRAWARELGGIGYPLLADADRTAASVRSLSV